MNSFGVYSQLNEHVELAAGDVDVTSLQPLINQHLNSVVEQFQEYFGALMLATDSYAWICDPCTFDVAQPNSFTHDEENEIIELITRCRQNFDSSPISEFWLSAAPEFKHLSRKGVNYLLPFASTYLCKCGFSSPTKIKSKYHAKLATVENDLRVCLCSIQP